MYAYSYVSKYCVCVCVWLLVVVSNFKGRGVECHVRFSEGRVYNYMDRCIAESWQYLTEIGRKLLKPRRTLHLMVAIADPVNTLPIFIYVYHNVPIRE